MTFTIRLRRCLGTCGGLPGLGQLVQGRVLKALLMVVLAGLLWFIWMGWLIHIWSIIDAALWKGPR